MKKISAFVLTGVFGIAALAGVYSMKRTKVSPAYAAASPVFWIGSQNMLSNSVYDDGLGGSATLDTSGEDWVLTLDNFTYSGNGHAVGSICGAIYAYDLANNLIVNLKGTSTIASTNQGANYSSSIYLDFYDDFVVTIQTDPQEYSKATLNVSTADTAGACNYAFFNYYGGLNIESCILNVTAGGSGTESYGFYVSGKGFEINDGAEVSATGGTAKESVGVFVSTGGLQMKGGSLVGTGGTSNSTNASRGSYGGKVLSYRQYGGTISLTGGQSDAGPSAGLCSSGTAAVYGGSSTLVGGSSTSGGSYGAYQDNEPASDYMFNITEDASKVLAYGETQAINFPIRNEFDGHSWDNVSGSGDSSVINATETPIESLAKRVTFEKVHALATTTPVNYNGLSHNALSVSVEYPSSGYTISYKGDGESDYSSTLPSYTNAGTYHVDWKVESPLCVSASGSVDFVINKVDSSFEAPTPAIGLKYDGSPKTLLANIGSTSDGTLQYSVNGGAYSTDVPEATYPGTYTVYYYVQGDSNHNDTAVEHFDIYIEKGTPVVSGVSADPSLVYTGEPLDLLSNLGSTTGGTLQYRVGDGEWSTDTPKGIDATAYTVQYRVVGNDNYFDLDPVSINVSIAKAESSVSSAPVGETNLVYNGALQDLLSNLGEASGGTLYYKVGEGGGYDSNNPQQAEAGTYTIYYYVAGDTNHNDSDEQSLTVSIAKATLTGVSVTQTGTLTYNGSEQYATVDTQATPVGDDEVVFTYSKTEGGSYGTSIPGFTDAGTHTVYFKATADNHEVYSGSFTITIAKADSSFNVEPTGVDVIYYDGSSHSLVNDGTTSDGTIEYKVGSDGVYSTTLPTATEVGSYTVYYHIVGDTNHNNSAEQSFVVVISSNDKSSLSNVKQVVEQYMTSIEAKYPEIAGDLQEAIASATACIDDPNQSDEQIAAQVSALNLAMSKAEVDVTIAKINAISEVSYTEASKDQIDEARAAYNVLNDDQKAQVTNYDVLTTAETTYNDLETAANNKQAEPTASFPIWAIILIAIVGALLITYFLMFFVFNKWVKLGDKYFRVVPLKRKDNEVKLLGMSFRTYRVDPKEVLKKKQ